MKLLTEGNTKTMKGEKRGYLTYILHLAPSRLSGYQTCPMATEGCRAACLNTAGQGGMIKGSGGMSGEQLLAGIAKGSHTNHVQEARIKRTRWLFTDRTSFLDKLVREIEAGINRAERRGMVPVFRLNGTSDLRFEVMPVVRHGYEFDHIFDAFPDVQFYDYTKLPNRRVSHIPNYHLTFSLAESNDEHASTALNNGMNVAAVFRTVPATFWGRPVINGDDTDLRFLDPAGVIVGLTAKGKAKKDRSGFVRN